MADRMRRAFNRWWDRASENARIAAASVVHLAALALIAGGVYSALYACYGPGGAFHG
ncbi:hypothetical protein AB0A05_26965 [Streptomyces sp. NPDC046374]|uniref:hypothetical protein n=1 Tax=Streptomyces sp. NPDC046374 TaxID=3154917 RepID=UPI0033D962F2